MKINTKNDISESIVSAALAGADEVEILADICERLVGSGLPLVRASVAGNLLDPTLGARGVRWLRGRGLDESFPRRNDASGRGMDP